MKKRIITLVLSALAVVLLVGVGFASWVVSQGAGSEQTGNILVETVKDERLHVTVTPDGKKFQFGSLSSSHEASDWLYEDDAENQIVQNLTVSFEVVVTRDQAFGVEAGQPTDLSISLDFSDKLIVIVDGNPVDSDPDTEGVQPQEIAYPTGLIQKVGATYAAAVAGEGKWDLSNENKTATTVVTLELKWGTLFGEVNPYTFFNAHEVNEKLTTTEVNALTAAGLQWDSAAFTTENTFGDYAVAALRAIYALNNYQFKLTITLA